MKSVIQNSIINSSMQVKKMNEEMVRQALKLMRQGTKLMVSKAIGDEFQSAAARVGAVATSGYIASLVGPPALGFLGEHVGLLHAMIAVLIGVIISATLTKWARPI